MPLVVVLVYCFYIQKIKLSPSAYRAVEKDFQNQKEFSVQD